MKIGEYVVYKEQNCIIHDILNDYCTIEFLDPFKSYYLKYTNHKFSSEFVKVLVSKVIKWIPKIGDYAFTMDIKGSKMNNKVIKITKINCFDEYTLSYFEYNHISDSTNKEEPSFGWIKSNNLRPATQKEIENYDKSTMNKDKFLDRDYKYLKHFLEEKGLWDEYLYNLNKPLSKIPSPGAYIYSAFSWDKSESGVEIWINVDREWREFVRSVKSREFFLNKKESSNPETEKSEEHEFLDVDYKELKSFLESRNLWDEYLQYLDEPLSKIIEKSSYISNAFPWSKSKGGSSIWFNVDREWRIHLENFKEKENLISKVERSQRIKEESHFDSSMKELEDLKKSLETKGTSKNIEVYDIFNKLNETTLLK